MVLNCRVTVQAVWVSGRQVGWGVGVAEIAGRVAPGARVAVTVEPLRGVVTVDRTCVAPGDAMGVDGVGLAPRAQAVAPRSRSAAQAIPPARVRHVVGTVNGAHHLLTAVFPQSMVCVPSSPAVDHTPSAAVSSPRSRSTPSTSGSNAPVVAIPSPE